MRGFPAVASTDVFQQPRRAVEAFDSMKESGTGREPGLEGLQAYREAKDVSFKLRD
jgi:hypothetical protein